MQVTPDMINGGFELFSAILFLLNIRILLRDKDVKGVSLVPAAFFTTWGFWNLFYYSNLDQWYSFYGGVVLVAVNAVWVSLALYYRRQTKQPEICNKCWEEIPNKQCSYCSTKGIKWQYLDL